MNGIVCAFQGRLGQDAELRYTSGGVAMLSVGIAVEDAKREGAPTEWARVTCWGELAEQLDGRLSKGSEVYVEGRLKFDTWSGKDGAPRSGLSVSAWKIEVLGAIVGRAPGFYRTM